MLVTSLPAVCTGAEKAFVVLAMLRIRDVALCVVTPCSLVVGTDVSKKYTTSVFRVDMNRVVLQTSKVQQGSVQRIPYLLA